MKKKIKPVKAWGLWNCVKNLIIPGTVAASKIKSKDLAKKYFDGGWCAGCKIVRVEIRVTR